MEGGLGCGPAIRTRRSHLRRRVGPAAALACLGGLAAASPAAASVTIGQLPASPPAPTCASNADYLQPSVTGGNLYVAREAGTITSWSTRSLSSGGTYVLKIFRRTTDPDAFQVVAHSPQHALSPGLNTVPVGIPVRSGDMIGLHEQGGALTSCTFPIPGDSVLRAAGNLPDGASRAFATGSSEQDVRLNLSAVLVPSNDFTLARVTHDRRRGTVTVTANVSNPGSMTLSGKGIKHHAAKNVAVPGPVSFQIAASGKQKRKLDRTGKARVGPTLTFYPIGGDPNAQVVTVTLRKRHPLT
jgi:hypothetical protein